MCTLSPFLLVPLLTGCGEQDSARLLTGFDFLWDELSHRISSLDVTTTGDAAMGLEGGDWSTGEDYTDFIHYRLGAVDVSSNKAGFFEGESTLSIEPLSAGSGNEASVTVTVDKADVGDWPEYLAVVTGFGWECDVEQGDGYPDDYSPAGGYTSTGFGVRLSEVSDDGDTLSFDAWTRFGLGPTGEEYLDRPQMDGAIPEAWVGATIRWTVIGYKGKREDLALSAAIDHEHDPPYSDQPAQLVATESSVSGTAVPVWQGFDLIVNGGAGNGGDYLRQFQLMHAVAQNDDGLSGEVEANVSGSSLVEVAELSFELDAELVVLGLKGDTTTEFLDASGEAEVGTWSVDF